MRFIMKYQMPTNRRIGENPGKKIPQEGGFNFTFKSDLILIKKLGEFRVDTDCTETFRFSGSSPVHFHFSFNLIGP